MFPTVGSELLYCSPGAPPCEAKVIAVISMMPAVMNLMVTSPQGQQAPALNVPFAAIPLFAPPGQPYCMWGQSPAPAPWPFQPIPIPFHNPFHHR